MVISKLSKSGSSTFWFMHCAVVAAAPGHRELLLRRCWGLRRRHHLLLVHHHLHHHLHHVHALAHHLHLRIGIGGLALLGHHAAATHHSAALHHRLHHGHSLLHFLAGFFHCLLTFFRGRGAHHLVVQRLHLLHVFVHLSHHRHGLRGGRFAASGWGLGV